VGHNIENYDYKVLLRHNYFDEYPKKPTIDTYRLALSRLSSFSNKSFQNLSLKTLATTYKIPFQKLENFDYRVLRLRFEKYGDRFELVGDKYEKIKFGDPINPKMNPETSVEFIDIYEYLVFDLLCGFFLFSRIYSDIYGSVYFLED
jgi:DNA polymerase III epsilon subunit-like protein